MSSTLEQKLKKIEALDKHRESQREKMDRLLQKKKETEREIKELEVVLEELDDRLDKLEEECLPGAVHQSSASTDNSHSPQQTPYEAAESSMHFSDEVLTDPTTQTQQNIRRSAPAPARVSLDTQLTEPSSQLHSPIMDDETENQVPSFDYGVPSNNFARSSGSVGQLEFKTVLSKKKKAPPTTTNNPLETGPMDRFLGIASSSSSSARAAANPSPEAPIAITSAAARSSSANVAASGPPASSHSSTDRFNHDHFPWSAQVKSLLQNTFRIQQFREHQKEVINCTLSGQDVFVLMRTGGGKSLTYQLPALFEGRGRGQSGKVTFVVSPLLSLIKDQEDQMNSFAPGSAVSFTSTLAGGQAEHTRRWNLVSDPQQGVCLVLITPEKISKSNKLKNEMQKLYDQNRLGRFVVDEAHCSSNWGHDFRPDYTKLGILRSTFPDVPIMAVTATASKRVRHDVCNILQVPRNCAFYRSSANRPNLQYHVRSKKSDVLDDMAAFIQEEYPQGAGIVYTYSKKDADTVASQLVDRGIIAESYHSEVSATRKDQIHQSWMRNNTQVVVATIAFGLGINKPDVRFVLHHTLSKTLEAYYQESGRAGRDGKPSQCLLYYSPGDVPRIAKMVHGESQSAEIAFNNMVCYAQAGGSDAVCRAIINTNMGEQGYDVSAATLEEERFGLIERRNIDKHAQTVVKILQEKSRLTLPQIVKEWRAKPENALQCVKDHPPGSDLNTDECERVIISLFLSNILRSSIVFSPYSSICYYELGRRGHDFLASPDPKVVMSFPKRDVKESSAKKPRTRKASTGGAPKKKAKRASTTAKKKTATKKRSTSKKPKKSTAKAKPKAKKVPAASKKKAAPVAASEIIELSSSDEEEEGYDGVEDTSSDIKPAAVPSARVKRPRAARQTKASSCAIQQDDDGLWLSEDEEYEFD